MPPIVGSPVTLAADDELLVSIGEAWAFAPVEVSAIAGARLSAFVAESALF